MTFVYRKLSKANGSVRGRDSVQNNRLQFGGNENRNINSGNWRNRSDNVNK